MASTDSIPVIKVLIAMHPGMDTLDFAGPLEALSHAKHEKDNKDSKAFEVTFTAAEELTTTGQGAGLRAHINFKEAYTRLSEFDVLIIPGGGVEPIIKAKSEPLGIIRAYSDLQKKDPKKERTLMSVCTGSLFLAQQGILSGLSATTHPDYYAKFEKLCSEVAQRDLAERCDVVEERYVVNNLRFDLADEAQTPYVRRKSDAKPPPMKRKGSNAWKESNSRRESNARRAGLRLGGLRVITSGGISCGIDAALYLVSIMVNDDVANESARLMQYTWQKGMVVDGIDI
ncbi:putative amidotransferase-domain-containing protein [Amylocarpus encephaloides]|uniref:Amidotransferase-domain-containing protein n=1 Tax=Amylocarpus encephaloides TaxID=45428 RepID=A0A9P7YBK4_9HELO|nr:putative amidotransferase-domain-containing protein [Amylocarpus encephaloides]